MRLEVLDYRDPTRWRFRLTGPDGAFVADHLVAVDADEWQYEAFTDLHRYLRANAVPDRRLATEAELLNRVGDWITERVLGPVAAALAEARKPVVLELPAQAAALGYLPWELARVGGRTLAAQRIPVIIDQLPRNAVAKAEVGVRLRMLAVFSLPDGAGALNLRRERHELTRLVEQIAKVNNRAIELRVLQYGATRLRLEEALLEQPGWDVVHLSGHGLAGGLLLEDEAGELDLISSTDLVELLDLGTEQIKLVTLSACESAAVTAREHLQLLGLAADQEDSPTRDLGADPDAGPDPTGPVLPAVAAELVARLDCAVLAMRYPVVDDFAIALADSFYDLTLGKGQPVPRALGLSLSRPGTAPRPRDVPGAPTLSLVTPALFGARAATLALTPPPGGRPVIVLEGQKLAGFPPQPRRFVGRVGPLTRCGTALAPRSGRPGVLLHGMAGAGKTACALELAYTHDDSFPLMAWHRAPDDGADISTALNDFVLALERQLPGFRLADRVADADALRAALPNVTEALQHERVLIVLDNVESLLTEDGTWRDERWGLLIEALTAHGGLSRLVMTSRQRPAALEPAMLVEPVHALSLRESVLLARELPNLAALIEAADTRGGPADDAARDLAARTLTLVQGHPTLIELADGHAADRALLSARLDDADSAWLTHGTRLESFLATGRAEAAAGEYLAVLDRWATAVTRSLPADTELLFRFLCCLDDGDRTATIVAATWPGVWRRLARPGVPPDPGPLLDVLVERAVVAVEPVERYRVHPGIAENARTTSPPDVAAAVDSELGDHWLDRLREAVRDEADRRSGGLVQRAARAAGPYLLRGRRWLDFATVTDELLARDPRQATAAGLLPMLATVVEQVRGTDEELGFGAVLGRALTRINADHGAARLAELLGAATDREQWAVAWTVAGDLVPLYRERGRLDEALALASARAEYAARAGYGPWTRLLDDVDRLRLLRAQGHYQEVLDEFRVLHERMATLADPPDAADDVVVVWNVRESLVDVGMLAARDLGRWQEALRLSAENLDSMRRRGATDVELARAQFADYGPLLRLGRAADARTLLLRCRAAFEAADDTAALGGTLSALADAEAELGHLDRAVDLETAGLRYGYLADAPETIAASHHNLAHYLRLTAAEPAQLWAHTLAAAVIRYQIGSGLLVDSLAGVGHLLAEHPEAAPGTVADVFARLPGVRLAALVDRLPRRAPDPQAAMAEVLALGPAAAAERADLLLTSWRPVLSALRAAQQDPDPGVRDAATAALTSALDTFEQHSDWQELAAALRRLHAGERDIPEAGLAETDATVVRLAVDHLAGRLEIDRDAWRALVDG